MSSQIIQSLPSLQRESGVRISSSIIHGVHASTGSRLIAPVRRNGSYVGIPRNGTSVLQSSQRLLTLTAQQSGFMRALNQSLKGGSTPHPILMLALGTGVGLVSGGAGFIFGVATAGLDLAKTDTDVLARKGDEIWSFEAIGKVYETNFFSVDGWVAKHIASYFIYDPFRANRSPEKGWLIHENRTDVIFE
jgi:hypothetical protein